MSRDFTITAISSSNDQYDKSVPQIPIVLSVPGVVSLRDRVDAYKIVLDNKGQ